eukprot:8403105-Lingulodinium_polyedra.AAC.1
MASDPLSAQLGVVPSVAKRPGPRAEVLQARWALVIQHQGPRSDAVAVSRRSVLAQGSHGPKHLPALRALHGRGHAIVGLVGHAP